MHGNGKLLSNTKEVVYDGYFEEDEFKGPPKKETGMTAVVEQAEEGENSLIDIK